MFRRAPEKNLRLLAVFWFLRDAQIWIPVWVVFLTIQQGFSLTEVTAAEGLFLVGVVVLEVPTGAVADRWGRSRSMALGAFVLAVAVLLFASITTFPILLTSFLLWSVASTLMSGADMALLYDTLKVLGREEEYEHRAGRAQAISWSGVLLATALGGPVARVLDIRATILIGAATCVVAALAAWLLWEPRHAKESPKEAYALGIRNAFGEAWQVPDVRAIILLAGTSFAAMEGVHYLVQPYLVDRGVAVGPLFSFLQVPMWLAGLLGALTAARFGRRLGARVAVVLLPFAAIVGFVSLASAPGLSAYAAFPLLFAASAVLNPIASGYINRRIGSERRATVLSINNMVTSLVLAAIAPALGFAVDNGGLGWAFGVSAVMGATSLLLFGVPFLTRADRAPEASEGGLAEAVEAR